MKIGLVTKTDTNPYFVKLRESAKAEATKQGASLIALAGKFDGDNEGQVAAIENLVQEGVKGILITPSNSTGILGALKQAKDKGVLVIALDTETDPKTAVDAFLAEEPGVFDVDKFSNDKLLLSSSRGGYLRRR